MARQTSLESNGRGQQSSSYISVLSNLKCYCIPYLSLPKNHSCLYKIVCVAGKQNDRARAGVVPEPFEVKALRQTLLLASLWLLSLPLGFFLPLLATAATQAASFHNQNLIQGEFCNTCLQAQMSRAALLRAAAPAHQQCLAVMSEKRPANCAAVCCQQQGQGPPPVLPPS